MKKGILYVVSAVLLGVALMLTPLHFLSTRGVTPNFSGIDTLSTKGSQEAVARSELAYEVTPHYPADEISLGLMSAFSLVLAFVVFRQSKKRTA
jgi:hypothetical protein